MLHFAAGFLDKLPYVLHDLVGLLDRVMAVDVDGIVQVLRALASQPDNFAALGHNGVGEIVVELLLWIGVPGIELPDSLVCHLISVDQS
jgi:hypothetical protein